MTVQEKAKELVDKMSHARSEKFQDYSIIYYPTAKICALIAVDEILNDYSYMQNVRNANSNQIHSQRVYWQEVKQEIEKL